MTNKAVEEYPRLMGRTMAAEMTGMSPKYFDTLRKGGVLKIYKTIGGGKSFFFRDEVAKHFGLGKP